MTTKWQTIRVFISSTFRDMHAERDWLVKRVFPALRAQLEPYRVHLVDIDLRWGVTQEQSENDQALDVCLEQIDECRPFFVGILGERYGWVSNNVPERVTSKWGWIRHHTGKSITELEILYGVLNNPEMHDHSFFFFRDPGFIDDVPSELQAELFAESDESAEKLKALKQAIRDANLPTPPLENYSCQYAGLRVNWRLAEMDLSQADRDTLDKVAGDGFVDPQQYQELDERTREMIRRYGVIQLSGLEEFGRQVHDQLWQAIKTRLDLPDSPQSVSLSKSDPLAEEQDYHERFMESRLRVYVGREKLQQDLTRFADADDEVPCLVTGPSGSGKSSAMAKFATQYREAHPNVLVVPHFIGASPKSTNLRLMLRRFCQILRNEFAFDDEVPQDIHELSNRFRDFVQRVPQNRRVVFVIDALNQLDETDNAQNLYWFPWQFPEHVKVITSCIDETDRKEAVHEAFDAHLHLPFSVTPLTDTERRKIVREVPSLSAKALDDRQIRRLLANPATTNPLFLLVALEELRIFGSFEDLDERMEKFPTADPNNPATMQYALDAIFGQVLDRLRGEVDRQAPGLLPSLFRLLSSARNGLSEEELTGILARVLPNLNSETRDGEMHVILRQVRPYVLRKSVEQRLSELDNPPPAFDEDAPADQIQPPTTQVVLLDFYHRSFWKAVRGKYILSDEAQANTHRELAKYFQDEDQQPYFLESLESQRKRAKRLPPTPRPGNVRKVVELPYHLLEVAKLVDPDSNKADAKEWNDVADLLTNWQFLEAKAEA